MRSAHEHSFEAHCRDGRVSRFFLDLGLQQDSNLRSELMRPMLERAIGVIYRPQTERISHYFEARLAEQFDAVIHIDRTRALIPLEKSVPWQRGEAYETYPTAV